MRKYQTIFAILFAISCNIQEGSQPPKPEPNDPVVYQVSCRTACDNLFYLGCEEGLPLVNGRFCTVSDDCSQGDECVGGVCETSCAEFCERTQQNGVLLDVACVTYIKQCSELDSCDRLK